MSNDPLTKFNPIGWCSDMAGANLASITSYATVYRKVPALSGSSFCAFLLRWSLTWNSHDFIMLALPVEGYESAKRCMDDFASLKEDRAFSIDWVS